MLNHEELMLEARKIAESGRCARRKIGAVVVDASGNILAKASNGTPYSLPSCLDRPCPGANVPAGCGGAECYGTHAERNALLKCNADDVYAIYSTKAPCKDCVLMLLNTPCQIIVFDTPSNETINKELWLLAEREWVQMPC